MEYILYKTKDLTLSGFADWNCKKIGAVTGGFPMNKEDFHKLFTDGMKEQVEVVTVAGRERGRLPCQLITHCCTNIIYTTSERKCGAQSSSIRRDNDCQYQTRHILCEKSKHKRILVCSSQNI